MVDIHTHLLPQVDDGSASRNESDSFLDAYADAGFTHIVCTPHLHHPAIPTRIDRIREEYLRLKESGAKRSLTLVLGSELYVSGPDVQKAVPFFKRFQLVEFHAQIMPLFIMDACFSLQVQGFTVVIAHVDRYRWFSVRTPEVKRLKEMGVLFQVNLNALSTPLAKDLLELGWIDFIATDHHGTARAVPDLSLFSSYREIMDRGKAILGL